MTIETGSNSSAPSGEIEPDSTTSTQDAAAPASKRKGRDPKPRPKTALELIEYSYSEVGRRRGLAGRDLRELSIDPHSADVEMDSLRRLAAADPFLSVPPSILIALAESGAELLVRHRILELVLAALADHPVFAAHLAQLYDPAVEPALSARDVSDAAKRVTSVGLRLKEAAEYKEADRERLRVNAVTAFMLFRVLRDGWALDRFVDGMASAVWTDPGRPRRADAAAVLAATRSTDALSQLSRHFERLLAEAGRQTAEARATETRESRRANMIEEENRRLVSHLESKEQQIQQLSGQIADLTRQLEAERSHRVVDRSHLVDDYETLRTQVIRRLSTQVGLLSDCQHALRNQRTEVAEEFLDRSLTAIEGELTRLKDPDGSGQ